MRKVTFGGANSLDDDIARPDHAVDWLPWGKEAAAVMADYWTTIDTILMGRDGRDICLMGGGELARPLFEAGLTDRIGFNIHPVLLRSGIPLFHPMSRQIDLELQECRAFKNGCVYVTHRVER